MAVAAMVARQMRENQEKKEEEKTFNAQLKVISVPWEV